MEEMIKQWEVFHQSIETRIDERVIRHVDDKLTAALQDPRYVRPDYCEISVLDHEKECAWHARCDGRGYMCRMRDAHR